MKELSEFLTGKSEHTLGLYNHFVETYQKLGKVTVRATKTMIAIDGGGKAIYITQLGKNFLHVVFPFDQPYSDNLCFTKIAQVPGTNQYNHHLRILEKADVNQEVKKYMKMSLDITH